MVEPSSEAPGVGASSGSYERRRSSAIRWWIAVAGGLVISLPFAWLLSFAAALPFLLGTFFFVLFGLIIGAAIYRIAAPGRPYRVSAVTIGTTLIVITGWGGSVVQEAWDFPTDMAHEAAGLTADIGDRGVADFRAEVADQVRRFLSERYPPGGALGYLRWVLTNGELEKGDLASVERTLRRSQTGWFWALRVALSVAGLAFGVASQTWSLKPSATDSGAAGETK